MKTIYLIICFFAFNLFFGPKSFGQKEEKGISIAVKAFPSLSKNLYYYGFNEYYGKTWARPVIYGGVELNKILTSNLIFQFSLQRSEWGFNEIGETEFDPNTYSYRDRYFYLTMPIVFLREFNRFYYGLGINTSYFLKQEQIKNGISKTYLYPNKNKDLEKANSWLFGINAKFGIKLPLSKNLNFQTEFFGLFANKGLKSNPSQFWNFEGFSNLGLGFGIEYEIKKKKTTANNGS